MKNFFLKVLLMYFTSVFCLEAQSIGISYDEFISHYRPQKTLMWCWASSAEMVLSYEGISLTQEAIVTKIKGFPISHGGNPEEMIRSTNAIFVDVHGKQVVVSGQFILGAPIPTVLFNQLNHKRPVILTYKTTSSWIGHAVVLIGIDYSIENRSLLITKFYIFDPFCYRQIYDNMGRLVFVEDHQLIYKEYILQMSAWGLQLKSGFDVIGTVTGVILMDASEL